MLTRETLLVVGSNPPSQTSGQRTLARVEQARIVLGFERVVVANLFALPTYRSGGVSELGQVPDRKMSSSLRHVSLRGLYEGLR